MQIQGNHLPCAATMEWGENNLIRLLNEIDQKNLLIWLVCHCTISILTSSLSAFLFQCALNKTSCILRVACVTQPLARWTRTLLPSRNLTARGSPWQGWPPCMSGTNKCLPWAQKSPRSSGWISWASRWDGWAALDSALSPISRFVLFLHCSAPARAGSALRYLINWGFKASNFPWQTAFLSNSLQRTV